MQEKTEEELASRRRRLRRCVVAGCLLTVGGWVLLPLTPWGSIALSVAGIVMSAIGWRIGRSAARNWATTSIVAATVLLAVLLTFCLLVNC